MTIDTQTALQLTRIGNVDPATAFDAWTQPEHIRRWSCPEDHTISDSRVDLTVGGNYKLQMQGPEGQPVPVTVTAVDEENSTIDANHQLAGQNLNFELELVEVI